MDEGALLRFVESLDSTDLESHSFMVLKNGSVVAEGSWLPYRIESPHLIYSLTKSFMSTAVGFAVAEGLFSLDDSLEKLFPDQVPAAPDANLPRATVRNLLTMTVGYEEDPTIGVKTGTWDSCVRAFLSHTAVHPPGEHFCYSTGASNMLGILIQKTSGVPLDEYLKPRLLEPLEINETRWTRGADFAWGGSGLYAPVEAIAKLGLLYLNKGKWNGRQLLPLGWAEMATSRQVSNGTDPDNDWNQGYGFQFWMTRQGIFRGDGAFGQFCIVIPAHNAVVAITSGDSEMQPVLDRLYQYLLPSFDQSKSDPQLLQKLPNLELAPRIPSAAHDVEIDYRDDDLEVKTSGNSVTLKWSKEFTIPLDQWTEVDFDFRLGIPRPCSARARWVSPAELNVKVVDLSSPHFVLFTIRKEGSDARAQISDRGIL
jgi:CubicO group peptidase (beta-lactamase class C family)